MVTTNLPSGLQMKSLGKRRQRVRYYREFVLPDGSKVWGQTSLLPSDTEGRAYYTAKGFRLEPPEGTEFPLNNTVKTQEAAAQIKADAEEKEKLYAEIASLRAKLEDKGKQDDSGKVDKPKWK